MVLERLEKFAKQLKHKKLDTFIVTNYNNIFYLTGFLGVSTSERESILIYNNNNFTLISPQLYLREANQLETDRLKIKIAKGSIFREALKLLKTAKKIGFESENLRHSEYLRICKKLPKSKLIPVESLIEDLRTYKSEDEIAQISKAQEISHYAFDKLIKIIKVGMTEKEIAENLGKILTSLGAEGLSFETIVAAGPNAAKPHHLTGFEKIKSGEVLLFDFGAKYKGYCADTSRTIFIGKAKDEHKKIYHLVKEAQDKAIASLESGMLAGKAHDIPHQIFKEYKLNKHFIHSLGHGIGLEVHETPRLRAKSKDVLKEGMVFSIEPGLYFDWGGVRIEDLVTIKNNQAKILGQPTAQFIEI